MERSATNVIGGLLEHRYRVGALVARGGMSTVYRGVDTRLDRPVAIKVMDPRFSSDPQFVARFEREARAAAGLHHPGVVAVHDQGVDEDRVYLVMELVEGGTLRDLLTARGTLDVPLALTVLERVLSPLAAAHRAGLVHRDVKPENVLIGRGGAVKVADFGLVRAVATPGITSDTTILGTVAYLSPEQVANGTADARSDVYSAGVLLYEMLTGAPPYVGETAISVAYRHVNEDVPAVTGVPAEVAELVRRSTRREPFLRPADAEAFLSEVETVRARLGIASADVPAVDAAPGAPEVPAFSQAAAGSAAVDPKTERVLPVSVGAVAHPEATVPVHRPASVGPRGTRALPRGLPVAEAAHGDPRTEVAARSGPARPRPARPRRPPKKKTPEQLYEEMRARSKKQLITWLSVVLVAAVLIGLTSWWLTIGRVATVPDVIGKEEDVAVAVIEGASLTSAVTTENSDSVPRGQVLRTDPAAGIETTKGDLVRVVVSRGKPVVPQVQPGSDASAAERELTSVGLRSRLDAGADVFDDRVPKGKVVTLKPAPGTAVDIGSTVVVVLSKGVEPKPVPNVKGKTKDEAFAELSAAGFEPVEGPEEPSGEVDGGRVVRTNPAAGTALGTDKRVTVIIAADRGVTVPHVEGKRVREAKETLEKAGLEVDVQLHGRDRARVINQSIRAGERVPKGTKITIIAVWTP
ncbi:Stk1 family PASTA domain-containing Ser/Thr kinase [Saccharothrix australiensis]|uniref:non-specific serine/threonine protein kinase n=1 Tax=Saccharothrix australiensis TaxID=2072 RepID=A0A495VWL2_9PSEU|nr:Stk1 family PASTA domain-containing Ser/Thr kinase [Saccharothrix australiensis]RKT53310.1 serine/threonine-protein kinase [Saccharothrix australiensis]